MVKFVISVKALIISGIALLVLLAVGMGVYAYGGNSPTTTGHTIGELNPGFPCDGYLKYSPYSGWTCSTSSGSGNPTSVCSGADKVMQWDGSSWVCATLSTISV